MSDAMSTVRWKIGRARVTRIVEQTTASLGPSLLPDAVPAALAPYPWLAPYLGPEQRLVLSMHMLVIEADDRLIVVDTCVGNDKPRAFPRWSDLQTDLLERFEAAGFSTERVDGVLCTHMHFDHVGWNTRLEGDRWVPTFPNARYLLARVEWEATRDVPQRFGPIVEDSVQPIFDAGLADLVETDHRVCGSVRLVPTPGHTPGHVSVAIESDGERALITGDLLHHPCQIPRPDWVCSADADGAAGVATRRRFVDEHTDADVLVIGTHFTTPTAGHIVCGPHGSRFVGAAPDSPEEARD